MEFVQFDETEPKMALEMVAEIRYHFSIYIGL